MARPCWTSGRAVDLTARVDDVSYQNALSPEREVGQRVVEAADRDGQTISRFGSDQRQCSLGAVSRTCIPNLRTTSAGPKRLRSHTLFHRRPFPSRRSAAVHEGPGNCHSVGSAPRSEAISSITDFEPGQHHRAPGLRSGDVQSSLKCQVALPAFFGWCHWQLGISGWGK